MKTLTDRLSQYAAYHRDPRNVATHLVGVPMILVAVTTLLGRPSAMFERVALSPALVLAVVTALYYLRLDPRFGAVMVLILAIAVGIGQWLAGLATVTWLAAGVGLFVVGWIFQFVGHHHEGRKPAFVDDLVGLLIGPLFVTAELAFLLGLRLPLRQAIETVAGPMRRPGTNPPLTDAARR